MPLATPRPAVDPLCFTRVYQQVGGRYTGRVFNSQLCMPFRRRAWLHTQVHKL